MEGQSSRRNVMRFHPRLSIAIAVASIALGACNPEWYIGSNNPDPSQFLGSERGTIRKISVEGDWYAIVPDYDTTMRFAPENLPDSFRIDGRRIVFSGEIGEIPPNVRMWGIPLKLTDIREE
jgi:hypothetical protein